MKTAKENSKNLASPGKPMSQTEFESMISDAEKGAFISIEESKKKFNEWKLLRKK